MATFNEDVKRVQDRLLALGYYQTGEADGKMGRKTQAAILDFRNRNGLPLVPTIDAQLLERLETADPIVLPIEQTTATTAEVTDKVEAVRQTWWARAWARILQWVSGVGALVMGIISLVAPALPSATEMLSPVRLFLSELPGWFWAGAVFAVAFVVARNSAKALQEQVTGYQDGRVKNDPLPPTRGA